MAKDLANFMNTDAVNNVVVEKVVDPYGVPGGLSDGIALLPIILRPLLQKDVLFVSLSSP